MDHLDLSPDDFGALRRTLVTPGHKRRISLDILDLADGRHLRSITPEIISGAVECDVTAEVTRTLDVTFVDTKARLGFEPDDPSGAPLHRSRMLRAIDSRYVDELQRWVSFPVFTGVTWDFERTAGEVRLTGHGMERQALGQIWQTHHFKAKSKITDAIRQLLRAVGDLSAVPDLPDKLPKDLTVHPMDSAWPHIKKLAAALDRYAMYDGHGRFRLRRFTQRPTYHFHAALTDSVTVKRTADGLVNTVLVLGHKPDGPASRVRGVAVLKGPLSPANLGRNDVPLHLVHQAEREHLRSQKRADAIAARLLRELAQTRTDLTFPSVTIPMLEENDMVSVSDYAFGTARMRMRQWVLPFPTGGSDAPGTPMTVGALKRSTKAKVRRR